MNKFTLFMENEFNRLETAYQMVMLEESIIRGDYDLAIYIESTNNIDYYTEAEDKAYEKKKNVFNKMIDWFKKFFAKIRDKIFELLGKKVEKYEMWTKAPEVEKGLKGFVSHLKPNTISNTMVETLKLTGFVVLITNIPVMASMAFTLVSNLKAEGIIKGTKKSLDDLNNYISSMELSQGVDYALGTGKGQVDQQFTLLNFLKTIVSNILKFIITAFNPVHNIVANTAYTAGKAVDAVYGDGRILK